MDTRLSNREECDKLGECDVIIAVSPHHYILIIYRRVAQNWLLTEILILISGLFYISIKGWSWLICSLKIHPLVTKIVRTITFCCRYWFVIKRTVCRCGCREVESGIHDLGHIVFWLGRNLGGTRYQYVMRLLTCTVVCTFTIYIYSVSMEFDCCSRCPLPNFIYYILLNFSIDWLFPCQCWKRTHLHGTPSQRTRGSRTSRATCQIPLRRPPLTTLRRSSRSLRTLSGLSTLSRRDLTRSRKLPG